MLPDPQPIYLRLELTLEALPGHGGRPPSPFPGSVLRGMLGKALVDRFCPFGEPRCNAKPGRPVPETATGRSGQKPPRPPTPSDLCRLAPACPYGVLYAGSLTRRPPFALYAHQGGPAPAAEARLELTLYGPAWRDHAWVLWGLQAALAERVGKGGGWRIAGVARVRPNRLSEPLAGADLRNLPADLQPDLLGLSPEPFLAPAPIEIRLLSPTKLLLDGRPVPRNEPIPFGLLVKSTLDRFEALYGPEASPVLTKEIRAVVEAEAAKVELLDHDLRPADTTHHSKRSRHTLDLGGTVGRLVYGPEAAGFFHILRAAEVLHLGKNPTFGCGRIQASLV